MDEARIVKEVEHRQPSIAGGLQVDRMLGQPADAHDTQKGTSTVVPEDNSAAGMATPDFEDGCAHPAYATYDQACSISSGSSSNEDVIVAISTGVSTNVECAKQSLQSPAGTVWHLLKKWYVVRECTLVFFAEMLRAVIDVLTPLAMSQTSTWMVGLIYLGGAAGALIAPFALDTLLVKCPRMISTRRLVIIPIVIMAASAPALLLLHFSVSGAFVLMFFFGAAHSLIQALAFKHLVDHVGSEEPAALNACMITFSLFYILGFTVGSLITGAPNHGLVLEQQLATATVAAAMLDMGWLTSGRYIRVGRRLPASCIDSD